HDRAQHPAGRRRVRVRQRREQQGDASRLLAPSRRPRGRLFAVRQRHRPDRTRGDAQAAASRRRPRAAGARGDVPGPPHARARTALDTVDPTPYFIKYGENTWAGVRGYLDAVAAAAATPVIEKYTGVLAAADVFTASTTFHVMQSIRLDLGYASQVHP